MQAGNFYFVSFKKLSAITRNFLKSSHLTTQDLDPLIKLFQT